MNDNTSKENQTPVCGLCLFWRKVDARGPVTIGAASVGVCYGVPPTPRPVLDNPMKSTALMIGQANMRPMTIESEPACGLFALPVP